MNYSTAVMLFNQDIRAVRVSYDPIDFAKSGASYIFKTLDPDIKVGDYVSIPTDTRHKITVAKVEEVEAEIDFDSTMEIKWIVSRVPTKEYEDILEDEQTWIAEMKKAQNRKKMEDIKTSMIEMYKADGSSLETLAIAGRKAQPTCAAIGPTEAVTE
jgi:predicted Mrr-cat superfamily restriction endonuclease